MTRKRGKISSSSIFEELNLNLMGKVCKFINTNDAWQLEQSKHWTPSKPLLKTFQKSNCLLSLLSKTYKIDIQLFGLLLSWTIFVFYRNNRLVTPQILIIESQLQLLSFFQNKILFSFSWHAGVMIETIQILFWTIPTAETFKTKKSVFVQLIHGYFAT